MNLEFFLLNDEQLLASLPARYFDFQKLVATSLDEASGARKQLLNEVFTQVVAGTPIRDWEPSLCSRFVSMGCAVYGQPVIAPEGSPDAMRLARERVDWLCSLAVLVNNALDISTKIQVCELWMKSRLSTEGLGSDVEELAKAIMSLLSPIGVPPSDLAKVVAAAMASYESQISIPKAANPPDLTIGDGSRSAHEPSANVTRDPNSLSQDKPTTAESINPPRSLGESPLDWIHVLISFLPAVDASFRQQNKSTLERCLGNDPPFHDIGILLAAWSRHHLPQFDDSQRSAMVKGIAWLTQQAEKEPAGVSSPLLLAVSNAASSLPWENETFSSNIQRVVERAVDFVSPEGKTQLSNALRHLRACSRLPSKLAEAVRTVEQSLMPPAAAPPSRTAPRLAASPFRLGAAPPKDLHLLIESVCQALDLLQGPYLDYNRSAENRRAIEQARTISANNPRVAGAQIEYLCDLVFQRVDTRTKNNPLLVNSQHVTPLYALATFLDQRLPRHSRPAIVFWFKALIDVDNNNAPPSVIVGRLKEKCRSGVLRSYEVEIPNFLRLGNDYMALLQERGELDANSIVDWLDAYRKVAVQEAGIIDPAFGDLLSRAVVLAKPFITNAQVGMLSDLIDPANAKHPWTVDMAFPFLTSTECKTLQAYMKAVRWTDVRTFLTTPEVVARIKRHLSTVLADASYNQYKAPAQGEGPTSIDEARRNYERSLSDRWERDRNACEWYAYLLAKGGDAASAMPLWQEATKERRTHEERWNLAVVNMSMGDPKTGFEELWDKLKTGEAPYEHARFAAYLALEINWEGSSFPVAAVFRLLPLAAAHAYAFALDTPTEARAALDVHNVIRLLADKPFEKLLRNYRNPRNSTADEFQRTLDTNRDTLLQVKLKSTWRLWLSGYVNRFSRSRQLWEALYTTWADENPVVARETLSRAVEAFRNPRNVYDAHDLAAFLEKYVSALKPEDVNAKRKYFQNLARNIRHLLPPRISNVIWTEPHRPPVDKDPWVAMKRLLIRIKNERDERDLRGFVDAALAQLTGIAPDVAPEIDGWRTAFDLLLRFLKSGSEGNVVKADMMTLHDWLGGHPPSKCQGLLTKLQPLAEWVRDSFKERVREARLAPAPQIAMFKGNPGIAINTAESAAIVDVKAPEDSTLDQFSLRVDRSGAVQENEKGPPWRLEASQAATLSVRFKLVAENSNIDPLPLLITASYSWGVVDKLETKCELQYSRFDFGKYLSTHGLNSDLLPRNMFVFDRPIDLADLGKNFIGRELEIQFARSVFLNPDTLPGTPIYIHGIRKVGKTSLLNRFSMNDVLSHDKYIPLYCNLFGLAENAGIRGACEMLRRNILEALSSSGIIPDAIPPAIAEGEEYRVLNSIQDFISWVRLAVAPRIPVLLVDEFHNIVSPQTVPLLDLVRSFYEKRDMLFILAGWVDQKILAGKCNYKSHLFPLEQRSISFLLASHVSSLVNDQFKQHGVMVGNGVIEHVMRLTEGHPNLVQRTCGLVVDELNRNRRVVVSLTDLERISARIVEDGSQFTNSWYHPLIVTLKERAAVNEIIRKLPGEGAWITNLDELPGDVRSTYVLPLIQKEVLMRDAATGRVRIKGLLLERYLRSVLDFIPASIDPEKPNVAFFIDYENIERLFPLETPPDHIARIMREYVVSLGNPRGCFVVANWVANRQRSPVQNAFRAMQFISIEPLRPRDLEGVSRSPERHKDVADDAIKVAVVTRLTEERDSANDAIDIYAIASGDGGYLEVIKTIVQKYGKKVRLLACRNHDHLNTEYYKYEDVRKQISLMPEKDKTPDFIIDDLTQLMGGMSPRA